MVVLYGGPPKRNSLEAALGYVECALIDVQQELARWSTSDSQEWYVLRATERELLVMQKNLRNWEEERLAREANAGPAEGSGG